MTGPTGMLHLTLAGLSDDGKRLLLVNDAGESFTLDIDARLRAALRGEHARLGQLEIQMESTLRPRDIQARIRSGECPEAVAEAAQTTVDRILPYANPVLAERAHVAQRAQRSSVRRRSTGDSGVRTLGDAVAAQLGGHNISADVVSWDAWRREDGRWTLRAGYATGPRTGTATFTYDAPGNYVTTDDDDARWLVGDAVEEAPPREQRDELRRVRQRRLSAVPEDELPLGDDAIELANDAPPDPDAATVDLSEAAARVREDAGHAPDDAEDAGLSPTPEPLADEPAHRHEPTTPTAPAASADDAADADPEPEQEAEPAPTKRARKKGRASVPSWDEIMFGGGRSD
ncbi:septation protein SepH [Nocardioides donggukensis]|uniref:DUF3071 domain-containing protein n=1 Tax=Nocardioides donggukensis TaxID=2774019 RepID=A0A927K8K3_9ACTN|nr:septation protein SepH [Nocardioides donggukensis]MBD8869635.1 DUF3071 domain-containing protein [Nocardioides donggukensis]